MHPWSSQRWRRELPAALTARIDRVCVFADGGVDAEVRRACREFVGWLKCRYAFPLPLRIYLRDRRKLRTMDGDLAYGAFFEPADFAGAPYIRVAVGDYAALAASNGKDNALAAYLHDIAHEATHYFQWANGVLLKDRGREWQAERCAHRLLRAYARTRAHP